MTYRSSNTYTKVASGVKQKSIFSCLSLIPVSCLLFPRLNTATVMDDTKEPSTPQPEAIIVSETRCGRCCRRSKALFLSCFRRFLSRSHQGGTSLRATDVPLPLSKLKINPNISIESFCKAKTELFVVWKQTDKRHLEAAIDVSQEAEVLN